MNLHELMAPQQARFWNNVQRQTAGCWLWTGYIQTRGYGQFSVKTKGRERRRVAHLILFEATHGPLPAGLFAHHRCEVKRCVNPSHLELLTPAQHAAHHNNRTHCRFGHLRVRYPSGRSNCQICQNENRARKRLLTTTEASPVAESGQSGC